MTHGRQLGPSRTAILLHGILALWALLGPQGAGAQVAQQPGPATSGSVEACPPDTTAATKVYDNGNLGAVLNGPSAPTRFSVARPICIASIMTYHYNGGRGAPAGWVGLRDEAGRMFGPWMVSARISADGRQGDGRHGLYWFASPQIVLPAGNYTVVDSDQATWSHNEQSGRRGITHLFAKAAIRVAAASPSPAPQPKANLPTSAPPVTTRPPAPPPSTAADKPATSTPTQPAQPSGPATPASVPVAPNNARVLKPFTGYKTQDTCAQANLKLDGAPWRNGDDGATGPVETSRLGKYQGLLRHTMRGLRLFYGTMTPVEERNFDAFWAPFFDHPTAAALDYFEKITPLLDVMAATLTTLDGMLPEFGEALQDAVITDADPSSGAVALAGTLHRQVKSERAKLDELARTIEALGNPPDPLAAKCRAQKLHRKAVGAPAKPASASSTPSGSLFDQLATVRPWKIDVSVVKGGRRYNISSDARGPNYPYVPTYRRNVTGDTIVFTTVETGFGEPNCGLKTRQSLATPASWRRHTIEFRFDADRSRILELNAREELQICKFDKIGSESKVPGIISGKTWLELSSATTEVWTEFHARDLSVGHFRARAPEIRNGVHIYGENAKNRIVSARSAEWVPEHVARSDMPDDVRIEYVSVPFYTAANTSGRPGTQEWTNSKGYETRIRADGTPLWDWLNKQAAAVAAADAQSTPGRTPSEHAGHDAPSTGPQSALADDSKLKAEAIAYHLALAEQIRRDADRWAADASRETDRDRRAELFKRARETRANAQAEQDIADSLRTGVIVHTRTEWDNAQHQALVKSIKAELAAFDAEARILRNIPKLEDMLDSAGFAERDAVNKRIAEAIKSPDAAKRLEAIYGDLKSKVVDQGVRQMAAEQARVEMWDRRVEIAETVQETASLAIMLATLWNPAQMGSLALGYAGASGVAEDGIKGGAKAVVRSVSGKADALISAYEGATRIDPVTKQPGGAWGAVEGALWSIGTDKMMAAAGARIQGAKAHYTAAAQAAGRPVIKPAAKATREARIKEFDFKTPEERFHAEMASVRSPAEQAAVRKKHAIQVEREAMAKDADDALKAAEDAVRKGADPAQAKEAYDRDLAAIHDKYKARETRNTEHQQVMKELGFDQNYDRTNTDVRPTGSNPATASSDMDFTPYGATPHEAYQKGKRYTEAMKKRGHNIVEYGDRWVDTTTDATIWKPGFSADRPGSSSFEAGVMFGTLPHSDKFGTTGGIEWTSTGKTADPLGAVLANTGKAVAAGVGSSHPVDLHTVGKSALKAAEASGIDVEPGFMAQIKALRAHQTPEQAGVLTLGANQATKDKETKAFLDKVQTLLAQSYGKAKATSDANIAAIERQAAGHSNPDQAYALRAQAKGYVAGNDAALTTIGKVAPGLAGRMTADAGGAPTPNRGEVAKGLAQSRQAARTSPPLPADGKDKAFAGVSDRCKDAVGRVEAKRAAAKPGSDEARYLADLKAALEQGVANPAVAIRTVRVLSGFELPVILAELGVPPANK